ncbi:secretion system type I outer membrane efflux pump lipoprotein NodT [Ameyamaea chiangmaiensis NBRC 103196]|uniref:Efflux transporter outer membrane subunit n=1 Tax=Ameyamaea chiangmaiensis TaxID=442969 RepID=A0A850PG81_9PROT|nr:efflux transporter outer membrane subunit [Ameyamaea chiangmaiensis]MBS4074670.1 efflux transporter outer membrane subunit [Ameyamaea chiangmaiensis]NVN40892.1 efflux transporter outer membrane subunit [Ameyamaea chiangmaiensis]GBQ62306.1 secretion system type I outer membrane efflux pump lipoprotein NodT [Ameyamaea chiangmaiensis NBRC 103196]
MRLSFRALITGLTIAATGCAVGPDYHKPTPWTPPAWQPSTRADQAPGHSVPVAVAADVAWWDQFHDPELSALERRVATDNLDVRVATARLAESRAQLRMAGAERFPGLSASGSYSRSQYSTKELQRAISRVGGELGGENGQFIRDSSGSAKIPQLDMWADSIDASWEVDLWGRVRRQYEVARADMAASEEEQRAVLIGRMAELARDYMTLRGAQQQLRITHDDITVAGQLLTLAQSRYRSGLVSDLDVESARSQLAADQAQVAPLEQSIAEQINALSLLMGAPPHALDAELATPSAIPPVPPRVPVGIPSELARRRPDIREAEDKLHAATADVGEAVAEFYPKITIDASFGFQSLSFRDLGFWNAKAWNVGPSITLPIFQGGRLRGQLELKKSAQKEAAISYQQTVLGAWRDVDNALTAYREEQLRLDGLKREADADAHSLELARSQYRSGLVTYISVLDAQRHALSSHLSVTQSTANVSGNLVALYNALGGGWEIAMPDLEAMQVAKATH